MKSKLFIFIFLSAYSFIYAQKLTIYGKVTDPKQQPIIGANVFLEGTIYGTATDSKGRYKITGLKKDKYKLVVSMLGFVKYSSDFIELKLEATEHNITLEPTTYLYDQVVISANKYSQDLRELSNSAFVVDAKYLSQKNILRLDDALRQVSGVNVTLDQISIRGSSGYSRGAGTRVLVAVDGIPIYTPDSGEIIWELIPISEINKVEIIKGSASSLYGSTAIGGVVNIITKENSSNPLTLIKLSGGLYSNPSFEQWKWSEKSLMYNEETISHSRSFGNLSLSASISRFEDRSYKKNNDQIRYGGYLKANYSFTEISSLSFLASGYSRYHSTFNFWKDLNNALVPPDNEIGQRIDSDRLILGLNFNHLFSNGITLNIIPSLYSNYWKDDSESQNLSNSKLYRNEIKSNIPISESLIFVSGFELQFNKVESSIFGNKNSFITGIYSQVDLKIINPLKLSLGIRYDNTKLSDLKNENSISPKFGFNYKFSEETFFRTSIGKGFRAPSLAETFTSTTTSGITVKPNPNLKAETSYSIEAGINHKFTDELAIDFAVFNNEFYDMIEPGFDPLDGKVFFNNVVRARIQGAEVNSTFSLFNQNLIIKTGYTFLNSEDLNKNKSLKYRHKHSIINSIDYYLEYVECGIDLRYLSKTEEIDDEFIEFGIVPNGDSRVAIFVVDLKAGVNLFNFGFPARLFFNINNLLNYNYVEMIGNIAPVRNFSLNFEMML